MGGVGGGALKSILISSSLLFGFLKWSSHVSQYWVPTILYWVIQGPNYIIRCRLSLTKPEFPSPSPVSKKPSNSNIFIFTLIVIHFVIAIIFYAFNFAIIFILCVAKFIFIFLISISKDLVQNGWHLFVKCFILLLSNLTDVCNLKDLLQQVWMQQAA